MKEKKSLEVILGGQRLNLRTDADPNHVQRTADLVNQKLLSLMPKAELLSQQVLLVLAMNLADELLQERKNREDFKAAVKERSESILNRLENHFQL
jgi:cell division protein ZapA (FtsZ GTPase activity inhibitor)